MGKLENCKQCGSEAKVIDSGGTGWVMCTNYCVNERYNDKFLYGGHRGSKKQAVKNWNIVNKIE